MKNDSWTLIFVMFVNLNSDNGLVVPVIWTCDMSLKRASMWFDFGK
jgi:hypothetical protein